MDQGNGEDVNLRTQLVPTREHETQETPVNSTGALSKHSSKQKLKLQTPKSVGDRTLNQQVVEIVRSTKNERRKSFMKIQEEQMSSIQKLSGSIHGSSKELILNAVSRQTSLKKLQQLDAEKEVIRSKINEDAVRNALLKKVRQLAHRGNHDPDHNYEDDEIHVEVDKIIKQMRYGTHYKDERCRQADKNWTPKKVKIPLTASYKTLFSAPTGDFPKYE